METERCNVSTQNEVLHDKKKTQGENAASATFEEIEIIAFANSRGNGRNGNYLQKKTDTDYAAICAKQQLNWETLL